MASPECTVCTEPIRVPGASLTRCGHVFHTACIERWFSTKPECPLCKTRATKDGFTRVLRAPTALEPEEVARMRALAADDASEAAAAAVARKLGAAMQQQQQHISATASLREVEIEQLRHKRAAVHKLQSDLLSLRRELTAAERVEAAAAAHVVETTENVENKPPPLPPRLDPQRSVSREAVTQQSRQLAWRCQEIAALEEKIDAARATTKRGRAELS